MSAPKSSNLGMLTAFNGASLDFDTECMNSQFFHLRTWVFQTPSILVDEVSATVHPNPNLDLITYGDKKPNGS